MILALLVGLLVGFLLTGTSSTVARIRTEGEGRTYAPGGGCLALMVLGIAAGCVAAIAALGGSLGGR